MTSTSSFTNRANDTPCSEDTLDCTRDVCTAGACTHNKLYPATCLISGTCYDEDDDNPSNECQGCLTASSTSVFTNRASESPCKEDPYGCTKDECNGSGVCEHPINVGCLIDLACVPEGAVKSGSGGCMVCEGAKSRTTWTEQSEYDECDDDGLPYTYDYCNDKGQCIHVASGNCVIEGTTYTNLTPNPAKECELCVASEIPDGWTPRPNTFGCTDDGLPWTADHCDGAGECVHTPTGQCYIGGELMDNGTINKANVCQVCDSSKSPTS